MNCKADFNKITNINDFKNKKTFPIEITYLIDEMMDIRQQTVAWMIYHSMKNFYPLDTIGFGIELWCNYCDEIDPIVDDEGEYAASIELFVSNLLSYSTQTKIEILYKYGLHKKYDPISIEV